MFHTSLSKNLFLCVIFFCSTLVFAQQEKSLLATRITEAPTIDGVLSEQIWQQLPPADNFTLIWPNTRAGKSIPVGYETTAFIAYDEEAVYVAAKLNHPNPSNMPKEYGERDEVWDINAETFFISFNTYNDDLNFFSFQVTSAGTIGDSYSSGPVQDIDFAYDTVYDAQINIDSTGWSLEMIIPYSAIRFPKTDTQLWGINFGRKIEEFDETYVWSPVNENILEFHQSKGLLTGVSNVVPPVRLFFFPYMQSAVNLQQGASPTSSYTAGVDLKYGLSSSFTLDASIIPDFGQVTFDDKRLNLGPFEQFFSENRPFFTEGADMFRVADGGRGGGQFFYSRRIGQEVSFDADKFLDPDEELNSYESKPQLINLVKLSGITNKKLSIGFINAITDETTAHIEHTGTGVKQRRTIAPRANYNVVSLSQQFLNEYSSVSFINTNLNRASGGFNANNYAFVLDLFDNDRDFNFKASTFSSYAPKYIDKKGFRGYADLSELRGNFLYRLSWSGVDRYYNQNELGYYNFRDHQYFSARVSYQILQETKLFRNYSNYFVFGDTFTFHSFERKKWGWRFGNDFTLKNLTSFELDFDYTSEYKDYDEPREYNRYMIEPSNFEIKLAVQSNKNKAFSYRLQYNNFNFYKQYFGESKRRRLAFGSALYRVSNSLSLRMGSRYNFIQDDVGYLMAADSDILMGRRDIRSVENTIDMTYFLDSCKWIKVRFRNFWSNATYDPVLFRLLDDGYREITDYTRLDFDPNTNFNIWNLDVNFEWWFAPGSNVVLLYRNQLFNQDNNSGLDYYKSLKNLFDNPLTHQFSIRINYLIDYNRLRKKG